MLDAAIGGVDLSVVVPVYGCGGCLGALHVRLTTSVSQITDRHELVLVDETCVDDGWSVLQRLTRADARVRALRLSRNFGQDAAITAGLAEARGAWVVIMYCDLQDAPADIPRLWTAAHEGYDVVRIVGRGRRHAPLKRRGSHLYRRLTFETNTRADYSTLSLMSRRVVSADLSLRDQDREYMIALDWLGFNAVAIEIAHAHRHAGKSTYTVGLLFRVAPNGVFFRSTLMLRLVVLAGSSVALIGLAAAAFEIVDYLAGPNKAVPGYTSLAVLRLVLAGIIIISIGVVGQYVGRVFPQVKDRPLYVIDSRAEGPGGDDLVLTGGEHNYLLATPVDRERRDRHVGIASPQSVERALIALLVAAGTDVNRSPRERGDQRDRAAGQVADRLGYHDVQPGGGEHPLDDLAGIGKEVIQAGLHDHDIGLGQIWGRRQIAHECLRTESAHAGDEPLVHVDPRLVVVPGADDARRAPPGPGHSFEHRGAAGTHSAARRRPP